MKYKNIDQVALVKCYNDGMPIRDIAVKFYTNVNSIYNWLDRLKIPRKRAHNYEQLLDVETIVKLYKQGCSARDIGEMYNISGGTIRNYLLKAGCKMKSVGWHLLTAKNPTKGKGHTLETKQKLREANKRQFADPEARARHAELTAKQIAQGRTGTVRNKLEKRVGNILTREGHKFTDQYRTGKYVWDFYIPSSNTLVEANGTFWHADPRVWDKNKLHLVQQKKVKRDEERATWAKINGYNLRIIWELDT